MHKAVCSTNSSNLGREHLHKASPPYKKQSERHVDDNGTCSCSLKMDKHPSNKERDKKIRCGIGLE